MGPLKNLKKSEYNGCNTVSSFPCSPRKALCNSPCDKLRMPKGFQGARYYCRVGTTVLSSSKPHGYSLRLRTPQ